MKLTKKLEAEVRKVYESFWKSLLKADVKSLAEIFDERFRQIGTTEAEVFFSKAKAIGFVEATVFNHQ